MALFQERLSGKGETASRQSGTLSWKKRLVPGGGNDVGKKTKNLQKKHEKGLRAPGKREHWQEKRKKPRQKTPGSGELGKNRKKRTSLLGAGPRRDLGT